MASASQPISVGRQSRLLAPQLPLPLVAGCNAAQGAGRAQTWVHAPHGRRPRATSWHLMWPCSHRRPPRRSHHPEVDLGKQTPKVLHKYGRSRHFAAGQRVEQFAGPDLAAGFTSLSLEGTQRHKHLDQARLKNGLNPVPVRCRLAVCTRQQAEGARHRCPRLSMLWCCAATRRARCRRWTARNRVCQ